MAVERELKYSSPEGLVPDIEELSAALAPAGCTALDLGEMRQVDLYYDDDDSTLLHAGLALRVRERGGRRIATLKSRGSVINGVFERDEFEEDVGDNAPPPWPEALAAHVPTVDLDDLKPRMVITTDRHRFALRRGGRPVAELAFDEVVCRPAAEVFDDYTIDEALFHEVEIEALSAADVLGAPLSAEDLKLIGAALQDLLPLYPSDISKLERATSLLAPFEALP